MQHADVIKLRDAARRRERDFVALFNALWYRDFPIIRGHENKAQRAMWTTHIASIVKTCSDLMGFFTLFEQGKRTDAVIQKVTGKNWAKVEWEWIQPLRPKFNELKKLVDAAESNEADAFILIGYSSDEFLIENVELIKKQWIHESHRLIVFIIIFSGKTRRQFRTLQTYLVVGGRVRKLREQYALPWDVPDTRWEFTKTGLA